MPTLKKMDFRAFNSFTEAVVEHATSTESTVESYYTRKGEKDIRKRAKQLLANTVKDSVIKDDDINSRLAVIKAAVPHVERNLGNLPIAPWTFSLPLAPWTFGLPYIKRELRDELMLASYIRQKTIPVFERPLMRNFSVDSGQQHVVAEVESEEIRKCRTERNEFKEAPHEDALYVDMTPDDKPFKEVKKIIFKDPKWSPLSLLNKKIALLKARKENYVDWLNVLDEDWEQMVRDKFSLVIKQIEQIQFIPEGFDPLPVFAKGGRIFHELKASNLLTHD